MVVFWSHLSICVDLDRSREKRRCRMEKRKSKDPLRQLLIIPRDTPFDPYGIPISNEISEILVGIYRDSAKVSMRIDGKVLRYAFVSKCCRVKNNKHGWTCEF